MARTSAAKGPASTKKVEAKTPAPKAKPRCGLCGKRGNLTKTECCGQWICDDEDNY